MLGVERLNLIFLLELSTAYSAVNSSGMGKIRGLQIHRYTLSKGLLLRPLGNVIYFMPPYVITPEELTLMFDVAWEAMIHFTTH